MKMIQHFPFNKMLALLHARRTFLRGGLSSSGFATSTARRLATPDGYLHKTGIPTSHFQDSLPKLPVPALEDTMARLLASAEPLATPPEMTQLRAAVDDFMGRRRKKAGETEGGGGAGESRASGT